MQEVSTVLLKLGDYNAIKTTVTKCNLFLENIMGMARLSDDNEKLVWDSDKIMEAVEFCYGDTYRKKLGTLRMQRTKEVLKNG